MTMRFIVPTHLLLQPHIDNHECLRPPLIVMLQPRLGQLLLIEAHVGAGRLPGEPSLLLLRHTLLLPRHLLLHVL